MLLLWFYIDLSVLQKLFTCEITGHSNLTFKEALRSEVSIFIARDT